MNLGMAARHASALVVLGAFAMGCGAADGDAASPANLDSTSQSLRLAMTVRAGEESRRCQLFALPEADAFLVGVTHESTRGSHHVVLHRTTLDRIPDDRRVAFNCDAAPDLRGRLRGIIYSAQASSGTMALPLGVGLPLAPREVVLVESHFMNPGAVAIEAVATVRLDTKDRYAVKIEAGLLELSAPYIHVPAGGKADASLRCPIAADVTLVTAVANMSSPGIAFRAFADRASEEPSVAPFYTSGAFDHPTTLNDGIALPAGSGLRIRCSFDGGEARSERFQGLSTSEGAECGFSALYFPRHAGVNAPCVRELDMVGTGRSSCEQALACADRCPPPAAASADRPVDSCLQRCIVGSCPRASRSLLDALGCVGASCSVARATCVTTSCR